MKTAFFKSIWFRRISSVALVIALILPNPAVTASSSQVQASETNSNFESHLLTREYRTTGSGLVRSELTDENGDTYSGESPVSSTPVSKYRKAENLPSSYDLRTLGLTTSIKDQGVTGCCWSFGAIKAIESNVLKKGLVSSETEPDYSENQLTWFSYHPSRNTSDSVYGDGMSSRGSSSYAYDNGGSATLATYTLAKWCGPIAESLAAFTGESTAAVNSMAANMSTYGEQLRNSAELHMQNAYFYDETAVQTNYYCNNPDAVSDIKSAILEHGAMDIALYYNNLFLNTGSSGQTSYYQTLLSGTSATDAANHCVTIIGWDDSYSRNNFANTPAGDGAWLIANSYGTDSGDNGYFWLSYYEPSICDCCIFDMESSSNYNVAYQYDGFGWGQAVYANSNLKGGNIFTASTNSPQEISAVSFYTLTDNQAYKIQLYRQVASNASDPTDGVLIDSCTTQGTAEYNGYHTVTLQNPVSVEPGERFSIVVTLISGGETVYFPFEGTGETTSSYELSYSSSSGQSFLYAKWTNKNEWKDTSTQGYNNVCIKAFANNTSTASTLPSSTSASSSGSQTGSSNASSSGTSGSSSSSQIPVSVTSNGIKLGQSSIVLGKGESIRLSQYEGLSFTVQDESIARVSSSGKITALAKGTTVITISNDTSYTELKVTVKKAPSKVTIKPKKKKKVKKGKSFTIKVKLPTNSASYQITYKTSNKKVATVTGKGKVKAKKKGKATITVRTFNKKTARLKVVVQKTKK